MARVWSISSRMGLTVEGKAESQGSSMPTRWTPWPGKKRAVLGREGRDAYALVDACVGVCVPDVAPLEAWKRRPPAGTLIMLVVGAQKLCMLLCSGASPSGVHVVGWDTSDNFVDYVGWTRDLHVVKPEIAASTNNPDKPRLPSCSSRARMSAGARAFPTLIDHGVKRPPSALPTRARIYTTPATLPRTFRTLSRVVVNTRTQLSQRGRLWQKKGYHNISFLKKVLQPSKQCLMCKTRGIKGESCFLFVATQDTNGRDAQCIYHQSPWSCMA